LKLHLTIENTTLMKDFEQYAYCWRYLRRLKVHDRTSYDIILMILKQVAEEYHEDQLKKVAKETNIKSDNPNSFNWLLRFTENFKHCKNEHPTISKLFEYAQRIAAINMTNIEYSNFIKQKYADTLPRRTSFDSKSLAAAAISVAIGALIATRVPQDNVWAANRTISKLEKEVKAIKSRHHKAIRWLISVGIVAFILAAVLLYNCIEPQIN